MPTTVLFLDNNVVRDLPDELTMEFKMKIKPYPEDSEIIKKFKKTRKWQRYKNSISKNVYIEKGLKHNFDRRMRLPELKPIKNIKFYVPKKPPRPEFVAKIQSTSRLIEEGSSVNKSFNVRD